MAMAYEGVFSLYVLLTEKGKGNPSMELLGRSYLVIFTKYSCERYLKWDKPCVHEEGKRITHSGFSEMLLKM